MGLEVAYKSFVGNDSVFIESVHPLYDIDLDVATHVSNGEEGVFNNHLVWVFFYMDPHVLEVSFLVFEVVVDDVCHIVSGPFCGCRR